MPRVKGVPNKVQITHEERVARFWSRVDKTDGCWIWTRGKIRKGYGQFAATRKGNVRAHRYSYELEFGPISGGLQVMHSCDNPPCVRPDHLFLGTNLANQQDSVAKGRARRSPGEKNGFAKLTLAEAIQIKYSPVPAADVAAKFAIHPGHAKAIRQGRFWKHI